MDSARLMGLLKGVVTPAAVADEWRSEIDEYCRQHQVVGTTVPVYLTGDRSALVVRRSEVLRLLDLFVAGSIDEWLLRYVCDALDLADGRFEDEACRELIQDIANWDTGDDEFSVESVAALKESLLGR
jgi:hypothetical protein